MFLTFSVAFGLGMSWSLVPIVCLLNQYFYHYKVLAGGIAISGWGFGAFFIAVINYLLVDLVRPFCYFFLCFFLYIFLINFSVEEKTRF